MTPRILTLSVAVLFATVLLVAACSAGGAPAPSSMPAMSSSPSPTSVQAASGPTIDISGMKFTSPVSVPPGATVTVTNADGAEHTVTADTGNAFDVEVDGKGTATFTAPTQPGTYAFHCTYHPSMHGQLTVQ
ncbi:plastocyanin [Mycolicibacterium sp. BK556]|uniref:cupredoxin domain-containing protein n=1 Tax=Mycobacteriaceae TaxID=1762 RepID=UPI00105C6E33|nr:MULTISPECIES: cupredoxin domain-containing protein [Mycobacteriaceae]MBB3600856.1 plastocyanin [Mycolicibacterium sp. BK556]MBB3630610.1 plastocyanin [Mycolicibacterium sp. BK607]MBB3748601.1 plastocyanin [Mycolicibacterium sp. BK634]TDO10395.1 plastocyanin [Mycobacterium sp. BK086]